VGTPDSYLQAQHDVLERRFHTEVGDELGRDYMLVAASARIDPEARLVPPVYVGEDVEIGAGACVGSLAVVGAGAVIGAGSVIESSVVGAGAIMGEGARIHGSILGEGAELGEGCSALGLSVVGPGARLAAGNTLDHGLRLAADVEIPAGALSFT
jgi:NDP-sugar pyrophosphorylase family protein